MNAGVRASSPTVRIPNRERSPAVFSPIPHRASTGSGCRKLVTSSDRTVSKPSGFAWTDASLAISLFGPTPTDAVRSSSLRTSARIREAMASG